MGLSGRGRWTRTIEWRSQSPLPWPLGYTPKKFGEPTGIRTPDTRLRRPLLYPTELWARKMERMTGIEPVSSAWKAEVLPLYHIRIKWSGRRDSNSRPSPWQGDALPLSHFRILVEGDGFEPSKAQLTDLQSAPFGHSGIPPRIINFKMELAKRIELPTCWLQISCSTVEPRQRVSYLTILSHFQRLVKHFFIFFFKRYQPQGPGTAVVLTRKASLNLSACSLYDTPFRMSILNFHFF